MRPKNFIIPALMAGFLFSLLVAPILAGPGVLQAQDKQDKKEAKQAPVKVYIPKEVRDVLLAGVQTRQTRQDIPFTVFKSAFLPAQANFDLFLFLKMKNADLGFAPPAPAPAAKDAAAAPPAQPATKVKARFDVFLQFHKMENGASTQIVKEVYVPTTMELDAATYDPAKEDWYTVGYPLPPANYLVAVAVSTHDLKKIGTQYYEVSLPDLKTLKDLDTTPIIFLKDYKQLEKAETVTELHREFMRYAILQITPSIDNTVTVGDPLDLFFLILGAQPNDQNKYDIECQFEVRQGDKDAVKFPPTKYGNPFISQPLPLKQTLLTKDKDGKENQSTKDLAAGSYTFICKMTDKISGRSCTKTVDFTVQ
jgi:hypothetical protein